MGWIETICSDSNTSNQNDQSKFQRISKYHPYNALWAQLSDICGAIGTPKKSTKTVICGAQSIIINKILNTLTYFIRCGEIKRIFATKSIRAEEIEDMLSTKEKTTTASSQQLSVPNECETITGRLVRSKTISKSLATVNSDSFQEAADDKCIDSNGENPNQSPTIIDCDDEMNELNVETALDAMSVLDESENCPKICDTSVNYVKKTALNENEFVNKKYENDNEDASEDSNGNETKKSKNENVVFMLGENEVLSGIKKSLQSDKRTSQNDSSDTNKEIKPKKKKPCTHKKHSGVKFNFERYPQIVTNYMRNKNLDIDGYDFLQKGIKLEQENESTSGACSTNLLPLIVPEDPSEEEEEEECECCANTFRILQTPSNATELEFSSDDNTYPIPSLLSTKSNSKTKNQEKSKTKDDKKLMKIEKGLGPEKKTLNLIYLPIPKTTVLQDVFGKNKTSINLHPGFVPSLFVGVSDHYIPDMILQVINTISVYL